VSNGDQVFFASKPLRDFGQGSIWVTDGTESGTSQLTHPEVGTFSRVVAFKPYEDGVAFLHARGVNGNMQLWYSDGTLPGTRRLLDGPVASLEAQHGFAVAGGTIYVFSSGWISAVDVPNRQPVHVANIFDFSDLAYIRGIVTVGDRIWFNVGIGDTSQLWTTKEPGGTDLQLVHTSESRSVRLDQIHARDDGFLFQWNQKIWFTDGTESGTRTISDGTGDIIGEYNGDDVILRWPEPGTRELWTSDGTASGTEKLLTLSPFKGFATPRLSPLTLGETLLFVDKSETQNAGDSSASLFAYEPASGVTQLATFDNGIPDGLAKVNGEVFFVAGDSLSSAQLWTTDGTVSGTQVIYGSTTGDAGSSIRSLRASGDHLFVERGDFFVSMDEPSLFALDRGGDHRELNVEVHEGSGRTRMTPLNDGVILVGGNAIDLWYADGTDANTRRLLRAPTSHSFSTIEVFNDLAFFPYFTEEHGLELWQSDGTQSGTKLVLDIRSGTRGSSPEKLTVIGDRLYFQATSEQSGSTEVWTTDGTSIGTFRVPESDIARQQIVSDRGSSWQGDERVFYRYESAMWQTDRNAAAPPVALPWLPDDSTDLHFLEDDLFYYSMRDTSRFEMFSTDGTREGTKTILSVPTGPFGFENFFVPRVERFTSLEDGKVAFSVRLDGQDSFIYETDGTPEGTRVLAELTNARVTDDIFAYVEGSLFFSATDPEHGHELWLTDGTQTRVYDINPGPASSLVGILRLATTWDDALYFVADDGIHGTEVWKATAERPLEGDINLDGEVGFADFLLLAANFPLQNARPSQGDLNNDEMVDFSDFLILSENFGRRTNSL